MLIRNMNHSDIEFAYHCTSKEGWVSETKEVFESFLSFNPKGCFVAEKDSKKIGICVATPYKTNGFIGELVIIKEMRGQGYGSKLFEHTIQYLKSKGILNIYLDADLDAVPIYEKYGFRKITKSLRFVGKIKGKKNPLVQKATQGDLIKICDLDAQAFGDDRSFFLRRRYELFPNLCFVSIIENSITGYIFGRPGIDVFSVVPLVVLSERITPNELLETFAIELHNHNLRIGVLESNIKAVEFFKSIQSLEEEVPCWRMVLGPSEKLGLGEKLYSIGSGAKG